MSDKDYTKIVQTKSTLRNEKIRIYPDTKQIDILQKWFDLYRKMYNVTTRFLRDKMWDNNDRLINSNISKYVNFRVLRTTYLKDQKESLCKHNINKHLLDQAIAKCVAMYKSAITNYKNGNVKKFRIRTLKREKRYKNLIIEGCLFSKNKNSFCTSILGEIPSDKFFNNTKTAVLVYDKYKSRYTLHIPRDTDIGNFHTRKLTCGIDPGARTFLTVYSSKDCYQICNNPDFSKNYRRIDRLNQVFSVEEDKKCRKYKKAISKMYDKINNKVRDMHFKVAKHLCSRYHILKLGNFSTNKIVSRETGNIGKKTRRLLYTLSHYRFREILKSQAEKYGVQLKVVSEYMTTKKCSQCKKSNEVGKSKIYNCKNCHLIADRDINAAKNIRYV